MFAQKNSAFMYKSKSVDKKDRKNDTIDGEFWED
jgi:hypothetical protein